MTRYRDAIDHMNFLEKDNTRHLVISMKNFNSDSIETIKTHRQEIAEIASTMKYNNKDLTDVWLTIQREHDLFET